MHNRPSKHTTMQHTMCQQNVRTNRQTNHTQIASGYDPDILLISEILADNSKLLKLHRPNLHFELHGGYTKTDAF